MAIDFTKPATTDNYATAFVPNIQANQAALAQWLDSAQTAITGTPPTFAKRYNATSTGVEQWSGSAWVPIALQGIQTSGGNVGVGGAPAAKLNVVGGTTITTLADWNTKANTQFNLANPAVRLGVGYTAADLPELQGYDSSNSPRDIVLQRLGGRIGIARTPAYILDSLTGTTGAKLFRFSATGGTDLFGHSDSGGAGITNSDPQTGGAMVYLAGTTVQNYTGGTLRTTLDASGRFGIAVTPTYILDVLAPASGAKLFRFTAAGAATLFGYTDTGGAGITNTDPQSGGSMVYLSGQTVQLYTAGAERLRVDASGNIGVNVSSITAAIEVLRSGTAEFVLRGNSAAYGAGFSLSQSSTAANVFNRANTDIVFGTNGLDRMHLTAAGLLQMASGNTGGGVQLPNAANANGAVMDWYEENTFTPTVTGASSAGAPAAYTVQSGRYVRFGRMVFVHIEIGWTTHSGTGNTQINGLPYAAAFSQKPLRAVPSLTGAALDAWRGQTTSGSTTLLLYGNSQNTGANATRTIAANDTWEIDGWYEV